MNFEDSFFEQEIRCGFEIPRLMKRAWAAQMELLKAVADICERHGLMYFADWGTLLGAVRHKGYVPWDDDIDICLKREDYMKLMKLLPGELPKGIEPAGIYAGNMFPITTSQTRVVAYRNHWDRNEYMRFFHGYPFKLLAIDIFPLDVVPYDREAFQAQLDLVEMTQAIYTLWDKLKEEGSLEENLAILERQTGIPIPRDASELEQKACLRRTEDAIAALYRDGDGSMLTEPSITYKYPSCVMDKEWYRDVVMLPFEQMEIAVPCHYKEVLTARYGNYMEMVRGGGQHQYPFYEYMEQELCKELTEAGFDGDIDDFCDQVMSGEITVS